MSLAGGFGGGSFGAGGGGGDKALRLSLLETMRLAWADPDLRSRLTFILMVFGVFALGIHVQVPIPGISAQTLVESLKDNMM